MAQFITWGSGADGAVSLSGTFSPTDASCSGSSGSFSLSATNASFASGQLVFIHQTRGTSAGAWEWNFISSYSSGTITLRHPLANTYTDSGASQAQVIVVPQYSRVTVSGGLASKRWLTTHEVGGIIPIIASDSITITGSVTTAENGYDQGIEAFGFNGQQGEGTAGAEGTVSTAANGSGAGGGVKHATSAGGGGGGGHATAGSNGGAGSGGAGTGGEAAGNSALTTMVFGGGGGAGGSGTTASNFGGSGAPGGGIILLFAPKVTVSGTVSCNGGAGQDGTNGSGGASTGGGGGGGAGGSIFVKAITASIGTNLLTVNSGANGISLGAGGAGGAGAVGRIRVESCSLTGSATNATYSTGGHSFCGGAAFIF